MVRVYWMQRESVARGVRGQLLRWFSAGLVAAALSTLGAATVWAQEATPEPGEEAGEVTVTETEIIAETNTEPGVLVVAVDPGSPAAEAGLARGDIILTAGETAINSLDELRAVLLELSPGDTLSLTFLHGDNERRIEATLGEREGRAYLGVQLYSAGSAHVMMAPAVLTPALPLGVPGTAVITATLMPTEVYTSGIVVAGIVAGSPAEAAGLAVGDLILALDGEALAGGEALRAALARHAPGDHVTLTVRRGGLAGEEEIAVTLGAAPDDAEQAFLGIHFLPSMKVVRVEAAALPAPAYPALPYGMPHGLPYAIPFALPYLTPHTMPYSLPYALPYAMPYPAPYMWPYAVPYSAPYAEIQPDVLQFQAVPALPHGADVLFFRHGVVEEAGRNHVFLSKPPAGVDHLRVFKVLPGEEPALFTAPVLPESLTPAAVPADEEIL